MAIMGNPAVLLVIAGSLNGLILPITLGISLVASGKKSIMGEDYRHPLWLLLIGILVVLLTAYVGLQSLSKLSALF